MRRGLKYVLALLLTVCAAATAAGQNDTYPYHCTFETDTAGWVFKRVGSLSPSEWCWGTADKNSGEKSIYISADGGSTAGYANRADGYYVVAYREFTGLTAGRYDLMFDCKAGGREDDKGVMRDGLRVAWIPSSGTVPTAGFGTALPSYMSTYKFMDYMGRETFYDMTWENITGAVTVQPGETAYRLVFFWQASGSDVRNPGACIDNVQLGPQNSGGCAEKPDNIKTERDVASGDIVITWDGNADEYELRYRPTAGVNLQSEETIVTGLTANSYTVTLRDIEDGAYTVSVRSICGGDTSVWTEQPNMFIYDATAYCLDYLNFHSDDTECTYGAFANPYANVAVRDMGYGSKNSLHTVHFLQNEYDPITNYQLKTVPEDAIASVRIGGWKEGDAMSSSITYRYTVTEDADVLKLRYAAVLEYADHHPAEGQTRIIVEILDAETDTLISPCTYSDFNAKNVDIDNVRGWNRIEVADVQPGYVSDATAVFWCDWTTIGINLQEYVGRIFNIRITLKACEVDYHFAYAYFTLDCGKGEIEGVSCGKHPEAFHVPEGFMYRWYEEKNPEVTISTADSLLIAPDDTVNYAVDLIFPENEECYFTLRASALPREPIAGMDYEIGYEECQSIVRFKNLSRIFGFWEGDTIETGEKCAVHEWDFGEYGTSTAFEPEITVPAEGDTFSVRLTASIDENHVCTDTKEFTVYVPSIIEDTTVLSYYICDGATVTHDGTDYTETTYEVFDYVSNRTGCDSIVVLDIRALVTDTVPDVDTVCTEELPVLFHGEELTETGHYEYVVGSSLGCDSIVYTMDLLVNQSLVMVLDAGAVEVCADDEEYMIGFEVYEGVATDYNIMYGADAEAAGFVQGEVCTVEDASSVRVEMPEGIRPGRYSCEVVFYNSDCGNETFPLTLEVLYPSSVIAQRWNDVLGLKNSDYNGGYEFTSYQWYKDGAPLDGEVRPTLYAPGGLDTAGRYRMLLQRADDGVEQYTCDVIPIHYEERSMDVVPTVAFGGGSIEVKSSHSAHGRLYGADGRLVAEYDIAEGVTRLSVPQTEGIYVLQICYADGRSKSQKITVVRR